MQTQLAPEFKDTPGSYRGPVPIVTHLHGAHSRPDADGYPEAWYLPTAGDIPAAFASIGSFYQRFRAEAERRTGARWPRGGAVFQYTNDQRATTLWYHDHTLGMTRVNVYAGMTGLYLLRGGPSDVPAGVLPAGNRELGLVIQDRSFNKDGSLSRPADDANGYMVVNPNGYLLGTRSDGTTLTNKDGYSYARRQLRQRRMIFKNSHRTSITVSERIKEFCLG